MVNLGALGSITKSDELGNIIIIKAETVGKHPQVHGHGGLKDPREQ